MIRSPGRLVVMVLIAALVSAVPAAAQQPEGARVRPPEKVVPDGTPVPRTPDGRADLSGVWNKGLMLNTAGQNQPLPFTPEGLKAYNNVWNEVDPMSRCLFPGVPRVNSSPYPMQIVQLPDMVTFLYEYMHNFRVIYTDGRRHPEGWEPALMGHSVGRWEGDTLVIETINLTDRTWLDDHGNRHSDAMKVTERWRRISANQLLYEETIDDPKFYTRPWTVSWDMNLAPEDWVIMEYACTDNNKDYYDGLVNAGPLDGSLRDGTAIAPPALPEAPLPAP